jgi:predicted nucleic acid-binding protein
MEWSGGDKEMERCGEVVLDSSVVVKWFSDEQGTDEALQLLDSHVEGSVRLWVVDLAYSEVANALRYNPGFNLDRLREAVERMYGLHMGTAPVAEALLKRAAKMAYEGDVTIYDALPVALAQEMGTVCVTGDVKTQLSRLAPMGYPVEPL